MFEGSYNIIKGEKEMKVKFGNMNNTRLQTMLIRHGTETKKIFNGILIRFLSKQIVHDNEDDFELDYTGNSIGEKVLQLMLLRVFGA